MTLKKFFTWQIIFGLVLISLALGFYFLHYYLYHDLHHIFFYIISDTAFLFLQVLIVTLVLEKFLAYREKIAMFKKLNMLIGIFFTEVGGQLLIHFRGLDPHREILAQKMIFDNHSSPKDFFHVSALLKEYRYEIDIKKCELGVLKSFLLSKRVFLTNLMANSNLLEHPRFENLLWAVLHVMEELSYREDLEHLSVADQQHLAVDIRRAYQHLLSEWVYYLQHLKEAYPYLYSLAIRLNPFDAKASVQII